MPKTITIASGKGGVGKSMLASSLAILFAQKEKIVAIDCDVDAPNLALWLGIDTSKKERAKVTKKLSTIKKPVIDKEKCNLCKKCIKKCAFEALRLKDKKEVELIPYKCEGCGLCQIICPQKAITLKKVENCTLQVFETNFGFPVIQGQLKPGEAESGEIVTEIREYAKSLGDEKTLYIQDAAAGIGCPVIASLRGSDFVVCVAEPTPSSLADLERLLKVVEQFKIPFGVVINKYDLNEKLSKEIAKKFKGELLGRIPYNRKIIENLVELKPAINENPQTKKIKAIFSQLKTKIS